MSNPIITIQDALTGETVEREMTNEEYELYLEATSQEGRHETPSPV
jgi:hypothetical protein